MSRLATHGAGAVAVLAVLAVAAPVRGEPAWVRAAEKVPLPQIATDTPAAVLLDQTELVVDARLGIKRRVRRVLRILQPAGVDFARFEFDLEPGGRLERLKAWTLGPGRSEETGASDVIESTLHPEYYTDVRRAMILAPRARTGDLVAVELITSERLPFPSYVWIPQDRGLPVAGAELSVELPDRWDLEIRSEGSGAPERSVEARSHRLRLGPMKALPDEPFTPAARLIAPHVFIRLIAPGFERFADWHGVARWYRELSTAASASAAAPAELMARSAARDPVARLEMLVQEVQHHVSYAAIEMGRARWEPDVAADTWRRRYGDCKDKSVLLAAALAATGIEARPVLTCTRDAGAVDPQWPDPAQFNHCILAVAWPDSSSAPAAASVRGPSGKMWTLFDPTDPSTPLGLLPASLGGAWGLIADPAEGLIQIPVPARGRIRIDVRGSLDDAGTLSGTARISGDHAAAGALASRIEHADSSEARERVAGLLAAGGLRPRVEAVRWLGSDSLRFMASCEADFTVSGLTRRAGSSTVITPYIPFSRHEPTPRDSTRALPLWLGWPPAIEDHLVLRLPVGVHMVEAPVAAVSNALGEYSLNTREETGVLRVDRRFEVREHLVAPERWPEVRALFQAAYRGDNSPWIVR